MATVNVVRRHRQNERMRRQCVFITHVNIFDMTEEIIIQTYCISNDEILDFLNEQGAELEPATNRSHAVPASQSFCFPAKLLMAETSKTHKILL